MVDINMSVNNEVLELELEHCENNYESLNLLRDILEEFKPQIISKMNDNLSNMLGSKLYHSFGKQD